MQQKLTIATRRSALALRQSLQVKEALTDLHPSLEIELLECSTEGDRLLDKPLADAGGKGLFIEALEAAISAGKADIAVHSVKDMPARLSPGFTMHTVLPREQAGDALLSVRYPDLAALPPGAVIGTSSLRRQAQLKILRPDLAIKSLRGNIDTRIRRLEQGTYDAIVLACAGLRRLDHAAQMRQVFSVGEMLPAIGQGALCVEYRQDRPQLTALLRPLIDGQTQACVQAERAVARELEAGCHAPLAAYAVIEGEQLWLRALAAAPDGAKALRAQRRGDMADAERLGRAAARQLSDQGAAALINGMGTT